MKTIYRLPVRLYGFLLLMGAMALALATTATGRTPLADPLALIQPTYDCATGAFKFNTTGGDGSTITYFAPGITGPTTNPNQFVDAGLRQAADAKPISLSATQSGVTATYVFDLRATCPVGTNPPGKPIRTGPFW
ncbi:hypothetical protein [Spirosoma luteum]|uniref:hypothetical protein n=1 Tax=Spirosoma luteum TaxID=431553 RepID=UPI0003648AEB|nr:hypothetical protein [Spirosoma luteum]